MGSIKFYQWKENDEKNPIPFNLPDTHFIKIFRFTEEIVDYLNNQLGSFLTITGNNKAIDIQTKMFASLIFFGAGTYIDAKLYSHIAYHCRNNHSLGE